MCPLGINSITLLLGTLRTLTPALTRILPGWAVWLTLSRVVRSYEKTLQKYKAPLIEFLSEESPWQWPSYFRQFPAWDPVPNGASTTTIILSLSTATGSKKRPLETQRSLECIHFANVHRLKYSISELVRGFLNLRWGMEDFNDHVITKRKYAWITSLSLTRPNISNSLYNIRIQFLAGIHYLDSLPLVSLILRGNN